MIPPNTPSSSRGRFTRLRHVLTAGLFCALAAFGYGQTYQAENATISSGGVVATNHAGYTGTGFVDTANATGAYVQFSVTSSAAASATVTIRYANGTTTNRPCSVQVNGTTVNTALAFNSTTAWATWASQTQTVNLNSGTNTFRLTATTANGCANFDKIDVVINSAVTAPAITTQPTSRTVTAGSSTTFTVVASGTNPLTYQWRFNGTAISGATSASYTLANAQSANAGGYTAVVTNSAGSATSNAATLTVTSSPTAPAITTQPASQTVTVGSSVTFTVAASGTGPLSYQWRFNGGAISGATSASFTIASAQTSNAGNYSALVTNSAGSATSALATLTVNTGGGGNAKYNLTGFATRSPGTTGGGIVAETATTYRKVTTPLQFAQAIADSNRTIGAVKVIEIMNDLNLGWIEVGSAVQTLSGTPFRSHATPKLHPTLIATGVSIVDIKAKSGLTIFSANGATIKHATLNIKGTSNIIVRNLKFDEMWEWDEASKGKYDSNDWDFLSLSNGGAATNVWIDHCTFTKAYDGAADMKAGTQNVTFSWCRYIGDDGATNPNSSVRRQLAKLEASRASYPFYNFLRTNGFSVEDIVQVIQGHDKGHLMGSNSLDPANATLSATFHHQWFQNVWDRCVPRLRAGNVHNYNIYVDDATALVARRMRDARAATMSTTNQNTLNNTYSFNPFLNGAVSTENGAILVEKSIYKDCIWPLRNNQTDVTNPTYTGKIKATDTIYSFRNADGTTTTVRGNSTDSGNPLGPFQAPPIAFSWNGFSTLPYTYTLDDPSGLPALLQAGAGAGVLTWTKDNWLKTSY